MIDSWDKQQYEEAESIFEKEYKDEKVNTIEELNNVIVDLMCEHGPDGHCDGNQLIALTIWRLMKNDPHAKPNYGKVKHE